MRYRRDRRVSGNTTVEFALTFPVFFTIMTGLFEFGMVGAQQSALDGATYEACRWASIQNPGADDENWTYIQTTSVTRAKDMYAAQALLPGGNGELEMTIDTVSELPLKAVRCISTSTYTGLFTTLIPEAELQAVAVMRMEFQT